MHSVTGKRKWYRVDTADSIQPNASTYKSPKKHRAGHKKCSKSVPSDKHLQIFITGQGQSKKPNYATQEMCYFLFRTGVYVWVSVPDTVPSLCFVT